MRKAFVMLNCSRALRPHRSYDAKFFVMKTRSLFHQAARINAIGSKLFKNTLKGHQTLFIIDDCSAEGEINKKQDALFELAFSGRHRNHSLWVLTQKYNSISKCVREQIKWLCLFFTKDQDSFEDCLRENDVIPDKDERDRLKRCLQDRRYSELILKCYQPTGYYLL